MKVNAEKVQQFLAALQNDNYGLEAVALADGEKILFEHHNVQLVSRDIYSHTKSFVVTGIGIAIDEGLMSLDDRLCEYFPEHVPAEHQPELEEITLRNLLTMSSGFDEAYLMRFDRRAGVGYPDYLAYMLSRPVKCKPGCKFHYSSADTHLAGMMLTKAAGKPMTNYLYEKLLEPMGIGFPIWEHDPLGQAFGGGGMFLPIAEQIKLGQLYLNGGVYAGKRLVSEDWVKQASSMQIVTDRDGVLLKKYGYQFWVADKGGIYQARGAYGQNTYVLPEAGVTLAIQTNETGDEAAIEKLLLEMVFTD